MSDFNSDNSPKNAAEQERIRRQNVENQRDSAINIAANAAADADRNASIAGNEQQRRRNAEGHVVNAGIAANMANARAEDARAERDMARTDLVAEREVASGANTGMMILGALVLAVLIGIGIWYFNSTSTPPPATVIPAASTTPGPPSHVDVNVTTPTNPSGNNPIVVNPPASAPAASNPPVNIHNDVHTDNSTPRTGAAPAAPADSTGAPAGSDSSNNSSGGQ